MGAADGQNMNNRRSLSAATLGALGVVYGDIGTSPLYALREATAVAGGAADANAMLGVLSLIFWSLAVIITLKYVVVMLRMIILQSWPTPTLRRGGLRESSARRSWSASFRRASGRGTT